MNRIIAVAALAVGCLTLSCKEARYSDPLDPEDALESFHLREGFGIELFATEPHVVDPVELVFDENGTAFAVEMPDYPFKPEPGKGLGRIKVLLDTNSDGRIDRSIVFADSISEATSILPWESGLIVAAAPYILFMKDTNADFVADTREILFSGFFENNSEAQITSLRFGIDNWIYAANNGQAGEVMFHRKPGAPPLRMNGADFRFRLDRNEFELETGAAQFGHALDDWGNRFITQNTLHIRQVVIPWRYLHRHAHLAPAGQPMNISDHDLEMFQETPPPYWRAERTRRRQEQYREQNLDREEYAEDHFTGSSGGHIYDGDAYPSEYYGNVFTGDVAGNLVHRDVLKSQEGSPAFVAMRDEGEKDREFLSATDPWFRPVGFSTGPDGLLYVVDMYRQHIETPLSIPEDLKADMDFLRGSDLGRIYRIVPERRAGSRETPGRLRNLSSMELVNLLAHPNRWSRLQAQRLLLERQDDSVLSALTKLVSSDNNPAVRLHALYVLEGIDALDAGIVRQAMDDASPGVRKHGLILAEAFPELHAQILQRVNDTSAQVAFQAVLSTGHFENRDAEATLTNVLTMRGSDPWFRTAVLTSKMAATPRLLRALIPERSSFSERLPWKTSFIEAQAFAVGSASQTSDVAALLEMLSSPPVSNEPEWQMAGLNGLKAGLARSATDTALKESLKTVSTDDPKQVDEALNRLKEIFTPGN